MVTCFPLDVIRTRVLATHHHRHHHRTHAHTHAREGVVAMTRSIIRNEGVGALYAGSLPALLSIVPSGAVFYGLFDLLKDSYLQTRHAGRVTAAREGGQKGHVVFDDQLGAGLTLLFGATAGAAAETAVYPLEVVRRRMQLQSLARAAAPAAGVLHVCQSVKCDGDDVGLRIGGVASSLGARVRHAAVMAHHTSAWKVWEWLI